MKNGILLAGGTGSRLQPLTSVINKHLLGLNGKFIIDYPIDTLKNLGCENITVILGGDHYSQIAGYLGDGERYNLNINYVYQKSPLGIAHAINLCKRFVYDDENFSVVLGDNIFEEKFTWSELPKKENPKAQILLASHPELKRFGVASLSDIGEIKKIEEKPKTLDSSLNNFAVTGCYSFTSQFFEYFKELIPSARGEYEITKIIELYLRDNNLFWTKTNALWSDAGTHESIAYLNNYFYQKSNMK